MDALSRTEYPSMLALLPPAQAVATLNERIKRIGRVNVEIADWLQERRKVEEAYAQGLKKLAHKQPPDSQSELGIFTTPWQKIITATDSTAQSHQTFATNIEKDVELPLRNFLTKNREMQAMTTIQGNLGAMAKELEEAQQRSEKLNKKGGKANTLKVDSATQKLETANSQWDTQAPFVFEKFQACDETRLNHLRDVLTQYQTHEADQVERSRVNAEATLNLLLEVDTAQEIQNFVKNTTQGKPKLERISRRAPSSIGSNSLPIPPPSVEDDTSEHSGRNDGLTESRSGLKRLGTMLGRRRQSIHGSSFARAPSPTKGFTPFGRSSGSRDGRPSPSPRASSNNLRESPGRDNRLSSLAESPVASFSQIERRQSNEITNGDHNGVPSGSLLGQETLLASLSSNATNGDPQKDLPDLLPHGPPPSQLKDNASLGQLDLEGFTLRTASNDPISLAQQEATNEGEQPQFKLDIKNEPIREEDADAQAALSNVANTLRSSSLATPSRKAGTIRGRRDVRSTIYVAAPEASEIRGPENHIPLSPGQLHGTVRASAVTALSTGDHSTSDTQSVHSSRSLASNPAVKHAEMHNPGLNSSIVETVSVSFENGEVKTAAIIGEVALVHSSPEPTAPLASGTDTIRLENSQALEAIVPNHAFVNEISEDRRGEYTINLSQLAKTAVAFRYKVHVEETNLFSHAPILLKPSWKLQGERLGFIIEYQLNPTFSTSPITINNLVLMATYEGARAAGCQAKPTCTHIKDKSLIYWRLGDLTLDGTIRKVVGRLIGAEGGEPKPGLIQAQWEIRGSPGYPLGSGLSISRLDTGKGKEKDESSDPFADESIGSPTTPGSGGHWVEVEAVRKFVSGKYDAKQLIDMAPGT